MLVLSISGSGGREINSTAFPIDHIPSTLTKVLTREGDEEGCRSVVLVVVGTIIAYLV